MSKDIFLVGTQYYRAPTPMPEDWERDLDNIVESGMNIVRLWLVWAWMNPAPGKYEFSDIDKILGLCDARGLNVVLLTSMEAAPAWLIREHPETHYVSRVGLPRHTSSGANLATGGFPGLCMDHEIIREKGSEFITTVAKQFRGHSSIYGWESQNEPMMEGARYHDEVYCYCPASIGAFRNWLRNKYETLGNLEQAWRMRHSCWEDIQPPREGGSWPDWIDWRNFAMDNIAHHVKWRMDAIAAGDPDHQLLLHGRAETATLLDTNTQCIDDWRIVKFVNLFGQAAFPDGFPEIDYALSQEVTRTVSGHREFWQAELQGGRLGRGTVRHPQVPPEKLVYWSLLSVAFGANAVIYWQYRPERMGYEYGYGLTELDGSSSPRTKAVKKMSEMLQKHAALFNAATTPQPKIAVTYNQDSYIIHGVSDGWATPNMNAMRGVYGTLHDNNYTADIVRTEEHVVDDDYSKYEVIYLPLPTYISKRSAEKLREFVAAGGTLVAEASVAQWDENLLASVQIPGLGLDEVFGVRRAEIFSLDEQTVDIKYGNQTIQGRYYKEILAPNGAEVIGTYDDGSPAMTVNKFGKGTAYYMGSNVFMQYQFELNDVLLSLVTKINEGVHRDAYTDCREVFTRTTATGDRKIVWLLNRTAEPVETTLTVTDESRQPVELICEEAVNSKTAGSDLQIKTKLGPWGVRAYLFG